MHLEVYKNENRYWRSTGIEENNYFYLRLSINDGYTFQRINSYLDCPNYDEIIKEHNGLYDTCDGCYYFRDWEDAKNVIEVLEPYLIMTKLTK